LIVYNIYYLDFNFVTNICFVFIIFVTVKSARSREFEASSAFQAPVGVTFVAHRVRCVLAPIFGAGVGAPFGPAGDVRHS